MDNPEHLPLLNSEVYFMHGAAYRKEFFGGLLFFKETWRTVKINHTGAKILEALLSGQSHEEIAKEIEAEFDGNPAEILTDINGFLQYLLTSGAITKKQEHKAYE